MTEAIAIPLLAVPLKVIALEFVETMLDPGERIVSAGGVPYDFQNPLLQAHGHARVWDARTGKPLSPPLVHDSEVRCAAFSPDGTKVITGILDGTAVFWNVRPA